MEDFQSSEKIHLDLTVTENGAVTYIVSNDNENELNLSGTIENWTGGYVGLLTNNSTATYSEFEFEEIPRMAVADDIITVDPGMGNYFVPYSAWSGKAWDTSTKAFTLETDVKLADGGRLAGLVFRTDTANFLDGKWCGANVDFQESENSIFRVFGDGIDASSANADGLSASDTLHLKLEMPENGAFTYTFGKAGDSENWRTINGTVPDWNGGGVGLLTFDSGAAFSNITFKEGVDTPVTPPTPSVGLDVGEGDANVTIPTGQPGITVDARTGTVSLENYNGPQESDRE